MAPEEKLIRTRLALLNDYVSDLRSFQSVDYVTYLENKLIRRAVERTLHLAIEACLDIGQHIIASEGFRRPINNGFHELARINAHMETASSLNH